MSDIFLSYARADTTAARQLAGTLEAQGWSVFWDREIPVGRNWEDILEEKIETARCIVVLWSRASVKSEWVRTEAAEGLNRRILVPAMLDGTNPPLRYRRLQAADLNGWSGEAGHEGMAKPFDAIASALARPVASAAGEHARDESPELAQFQALAGKFYDQPLDIRKQAARDVAALARTLSPEAIFRFAKSALAGERVAAAIGMRALLDESSIASQDPAVIDAVSRGLGDKRSRVRYRYVELVRRRPEVVEQVRPQLERIAAKDSNRDVRRMAAAALRSLGES